MFGKGRVNHDPLLIVLAALRFSLSRPFHEEFPDLIHSSVSSSCPENVQRSGSVPRGGRVQAIWNRLKSRLFLLHRGGPLAYQLDRYSCRGRGLLDDNLFLQRFDRRRCARRGERRRDHAAPFGQPGLWLPRMQRPVWPLRPHHPQDRHRGAGCLRQILLRRLPARGYRAWRPCPACGRAGRGFGLIGCPYP